MSSIYKKSLWEVPERLFFTYLTNAVLCFGDNRNELTVVLSFAECDTSCAEREQGVIFAHSDTFTRVVGGSALADDDVAWNNQLAAEFLHAQTLGM
jgi:hypothetical protein